MSATTGTRLTGGGEVTVRGQKVKAAASSRPSRARRRRTGRRRESHLDNPLRRRALLSMPYRPPQLGSNALRSSSSRSRSYAGVALATSESSSAAALPALMLAPSAWTTTRHGLAEANVKRNPAGLPLSLKGSLWRDQSTTPPLAPVLRPKSKQTLHRKRVPSASQGMWT